MRRALSGTFSLTPSSPLNHKIIKFLTLFRTNTPSAVEAAASLRVGVDGTIVGKQAIRGTSITRNSGARPKICIITK